MSLFLPRRGKRWGPDCPKDNGNGPSLLFLHGQGCRCLFSCLCWTAFFGGSFGRRHFRHWHNFSFKAECTTGGADILAFIIHKYFPQLSMGRIFFYLNALVLVSSIFVFREIWAGFYGVVCLTATSKILDFLLIRLNQSR